jgi:hypothetical protein
MKVPFVDIFQPGLLLLQPAVGSYLLTTVSRRSNMEQSLLEIASQLKLIASALDSLCALAAILLIGKFIGWVCE